MTTPLDPARIARWKAEARLFRERAGPIPDAMDRDAYADVAVLALIEEVERLQAELDARTPCPHSGVTLPIRMKCDLCAGKRETP